MEHSFNIKVADEVGIRGAVLLKNIHHWLIKNKANNENFHDGRYWTYNTIDAFAEIFPYLTPRQLTHTLDQLEEKGYLVTGNYNQVKYDRTKWYSLPSKYYEILDIAKSDPQICEMEDTNMSNRIDRSVKPIPDISTDISTDIKDSVISKKNDDIPYQEILNYFNKKTGKNLGVVRSNTKDIKARMNENNYSLEDFKKVIDIKISQWEHDAKMKNFIRPSTLFGTKFDSYLNEELQGSSNIIYPNEDRKPIEEKVYSAAETKELNKRIEKLANKYGDQTQERGKD